jgi:glycosyltransferase involved in cell wall biosynthesis
VHAPASVSIVITCFNQGNFLREAIQSVLAQARRADELIVVDDGSTDDTAAVAAEFLGVDYVFQQNSGLSAARNTGLWRASGEYVLFLDSDDILKPTAIKNCLIALEENPEVAFVYGGFWWVDSKRGFIGEERARTYTDQFAAVLARNHILMHGTVMYRTEILRLARGFDESLVRCEDYDIYLRLTKKYPIVSYEGIAAEYRRHGDNMTTNATGMLKAVRTVLARHAPTAQSSRDWRIAHAEGVRYWSSFWGQRVEQSLIEECKGRRRPGVLLSVLATGLRYDRDFAVRLAKRILRKATDALGKLYRRSGIA